MSMVAMYSFKYPLFTRQLSLSSLLDLSEKQQEPSSYAPQPARPRVAIIGAGITGIATACHIIDAGYDCHIFEAGTEEKIGGVWTTVNKTSRLQVHSSFYMFHPSIEWQNDYPDQQEILGQVKRLWKNYDLAKRITFSCKVHSTFKKDGKWLINDSSNGYFDGLVAAVGTCGEMYAPGITGQQMYKGRILHSSQLSQSDVRGKNVLVIGGGASAVEALEFAVDNGALQTKVLARSEKWFLPRRPILNACLAGTIGDRFGILEFIIEFLLKLFFYKDLCEMAPPSFLSKGGIFSGTPICNSRVFDLIRKGRCSWNRGDIQNFTERGISFSHRARGTRPGDSGVVTEEIAPVVILATGFKRPQMSFLPPQDTQSKYQSPNWYLQAFPTEDASIAAINCTWLDGIGSIGGAHIGVYTRFLLAFLVDEKAMPSTWMMQRWVDLIELLKRPYAGGPLAFVTTIELYLWFLVLTLVQPSMWKWLKFIMMGPQASNGVPEQFQPRSHKPKKTKSISLKLNPIAYEEKSGRTVVRETPVLLSR